MMKDFKMIAPKLHLENWEVKKLLINNDLHVEKLNASQMYRISKDTGLSVFV